MVRIMNSRNHQPEVLMKIAMAQMSMSSSISDNLNKSIQMIQSAKGSDLIFFPEVQLTPFFAQYHKEDLKSHTGLSPEDVITTPGKGVLHKFRHAAEEAGLYVSPNLYLQQDDGCYDTSLLISPWGKVIGDAEMVHVVSLPQFYEAEYYTPSKNGFEVINTKLGKIGIVICFDRHLPESIRSCALHGAQLIIIPTANTKSEPMDVFESEIVAEAFQNNVFIAMCNRVGKEGEMDFAGQSLVVDCDGNVLLKADDKEGLLTCEIDLRKCASSRRARPYIECVRPEAY